MYSCIPFKSSNVIWRKGDGEMPECAKNIVEEAQAKLAAKLMLANVGLFGYTADRDDGKGFFGL